MGNFFTSIQIHNPEQLSKEQFIELFCNKMKENGFVVGNADDHEISYTLSFADNCKWVAVSSESYEQGNATVQNGTGNIAKMLNTRCINVTVVDSDFAMLDLYSNSGKKLDAAVMGRYDDYLGDDISAPKKNIWSELISKNSTWERFTEVQQGDYVFVEDGLAELAPILGMDSRNILFDAEDASESDENICFLYFKKASTKKSKKLTLNAAFKQIFGQALEPLGFQCSKKSKYTYFVKIINNEIVYLISFKQGHSKMGYKSINIYAKVIPLCIRSLDLSWEPDWMENIQYYNSKSNHELNADCLNRLVDFYCKQWDLNKYQRQYIMEHSPFGPVRECVQDFYIKTDTNDELIEGMKNALDATVNVLLPIFDEIVDFKTCTDFYLKYFAHQLKICEFNKFISEDSYQYSCGLLLIMTEIKTKDSRPYLLDKVMCAKFCEEARRCIGINLEMLKSYGIRIK